MIKKNAPIILFIYNRPLHTEKTLNALMQNSLADESVLYIFADGPKSDANEYTINQILKTREIARRKKWCKEVHIIEQDNNLGLARSIINGVTNIVNENGSVIVLEDDIVTSKGFLQYMNDALNYYENNQKIYHVSGYMYPHKENLPETFFLKIPLCWGWGTWKRAWKQLNLNTDELINYFEKRNLWNEFNKFGKDNLESQLKLNYAGFLNTWFIKWHASVLIHDGLTLFPNKSLVQNIGFDNSGVHNKSTKSFMHTSLSSSIKISEIPLKEDVNALNLIKNFYNKITTKRILSSKIVRVTKTFVWNILFIIKNKLNSSLVKSYLGRNVKIYPPYDINDSIIGNYTYISINSRISLTYIGKYCSIGPNFMCGWGIHPTNGISTSPMFYSTNKENGISLVEKNKTKIRERILIGNDVFIGMNVTVLDGVKIGDGAIIGAGAIVTKDIPPYAIAAGCPAKIIKYRFDDETIKQLLKIKWWDNGEKLHRKIENNFFNVEKFINNIKENNV